MIYAENGGKFGIDPDECIFLTLANFPEAMPSAVRSRADVGGNSHARSPTLAGNWAEPAVLREIPPPEAQRFG